MDNMMGKKRVFLLFILGTISILGIVWAAGADSLFVYGPSTATPGSTITISVNVTNAVDLGVLQYDLTYNPSVLNAISVSDGGGLSGSYLFTSNIDNAAGKVSVAFISTTGMSGSGSTADIDFTVVGSVSDSTLLGLILIKFQDTLNNDLSPPIMTNGSITIVDDWPMLSHDLRRSGYTLLKGDIDYIESQWTFKTQNDKWAYPVIGDIDNDGVQEIVVSNVDAVYALNGTGDTIWEYTEISWAVNSPTIWDVDDDGEQEVIVPTWRSKFIVLDASTGVEEWSYPTVTPPVSPPLVADIDLDGKQEIVVGDGGGIGSPLASKRGIYAVNGDTRDTLWNFTTGGYNAIQSMGDIDNDGKLEIVVTSYDGNYDVFALNAEDGSVLWQIPLQRTIFSPTIADINDDGIMEIVLGTYESSNNKVYAINGTNGEVIWNYSVGDRVGNPSVADLDGDRALEVVVRTLNDNLYAIDGITGEEEWSYPIGGGGPIEDISSVAIADIDGDNELEIIVGSQDGYLYIINKTGGLEKSYWLGGMVTDPAVGDVDGDGKAEVVVKHGILNTPSTTAESVAEKYSMSEFGNMSVTEAKIAQSIADVGSNAVSVLNGPDPDLALSPSDISFDPASPTSGEIVTITATIHNQKDDSFTNKPFVVSFYDEINLIGNYVVTESILAGGEIDANVEWLPTPEVHIIHVVADSDNSVPESDETNNKAKREVNVSIVATIDINPEMLNLESLGKGIKAYIELPGGYDVGEIDVSTIRLNDIVSAELKPTDIGDYDGDGILDLMVEFDRSEVVELIWELGLEPPANVELTVKGALNDGMALKGNDVIRVITKGE